MQAYEISYTFRDQVKKVVIPASSQAEALQKFGNPHIKPTVVEIETDVRAAYLKSDEGQTFVEHLRKFEGKMYAKVRNVNAFFSRYERVTGEKLSRSTAGILISEQDDKWGDEMLLAFNMTGLTFNFPADAHPRIKNIDTGEAILNDNDYIWFLIENHGFRFGR
jgi:hypothetical protein